MLFYVRHRAGGRKKIQFDLHDLLFIPLETSFVLALRLTWEIDNLNAVDGPRGVIRGVSKTQHSAQPKHL